MVPEKSSESSSDSEDAAERAEPLQPPVSPRLSPFSGAAFNLWCMQRQQLASTKQDKEAEEPMEVEVIKPKWKSFDEEQNVS